MIDNIGALIIGIGYLLLAIADMRGEKFHIPKKFKKGVGIREWQKKRAFAEIVVCVGSGVIFFTPTGRKEVYIAGCIILAVGFILLLIINNSFRKL